MKASINSLTDVIAGAAVASQLNQAKNNNNNEEESSDEPHQRPKRSSSADRGSYKEGGSVRRAANNKRRAAASSSEDSSEEVDEPARNARRVEGKHRKAFSIRRIKAKYSRMGVDWEYPNTAGDDDDAENVRTGHYLYLIHNAALNLVKIGVTSLSEEKLIKRYQTYYGRVDIVAMYPIKNGKLQTVLIYLCIYLFTYLLMH